MLRENEFGEASQPVNDIWHDVCTTCHPDMDLAICGTQVDYDPDKSTNGIAIGQDCVVCIAMLCPTCPEEEQKQIIGRIGE